MYKVLGCSLTYLLVMNSIEFLILVIGFLKKF